MKTLRRRRKEAKTDYKARFNLLKSGKARLVVRRTNTALIAQIVTSETAQDKVILTVNSKDLLTKGWPADKKGSLKSLPAAYLTGFLIGKKAKSLVKDIILDSGMHRNIHGSRIYSLVKGAKDAGLNIYVDENVLPKIERIMSNKNISKSIIEKIKEKL